VRVSYAGVRLTTLIELPSSRAVALQLVASAGGAALTTGCTPYPAGSAIKDITSCGRGAASLRTTGKQQATVLDKVIFIHI